MTIKNFRDHAANERTFLAWIRTAIAIMAFGFLLERFDLFLEMVAPSLSAAFCLRSDTSSATLRGWR